MADETAARMAAVFFCAARTAAGRLFILTRVSGPT